MTQGVYVLTKLINGPRQNRANKGLYSSTSSYSLFKSSKAQTWSFDLIIAVVLFIVIVAVFYAFLTSNKSEGGSEELQSSAKTVGYYFNCDVSDYSRCFVSSGKIDQAKLADLFQFINSNNDAYSIMKKELGVAGDFCIYFRDADGYLVPIKYNNTGTGTIEYYSGIGENSFMLNQNISCGTKINNSIIFGN